MTAQLSCGPLRSLRRILTTSLFVLKVTYAFGDGPSAPQADQPISLSLRSATRCGFQDVIERTEVVPS